MVRKVPCQYCKQRRRKCERDNESEPCVRCIRMKRKCIPQIPSFNYSSSFDEEEEEEEEINEKRYFEIYQTIKQLENEMRKLEIDLNKEKSANALVKKEPVWHIRFANGHMMLDSEIKDFEELLLYGNSFIRYLSPFGHTFQTSSVVFERVGPNIFDETERHLESLIVVNVLQPFMMTTMRFNDSKKWASIATILASNLKEKYPNYRNGKDLTNHATRTFYASIHRNSVVAKIIMGIIDFSMDNRIERIETFNESLDILPDDPPFTKSVLEMFNYIVIIESHPITELIYKQSRELVLEGKTQLTLEDIVCYESILMDWWHNLPDYFKISKGPFDCSKELIEACTDTQTLLMCLYVHGLVINIQACFINPKSASGAHHVVKEKATYLALYAADMIITLTKHFDKLDSFCYSASKLLLRSIDTLVSLMHIKNNVVNLKTKQRIEECMEEFKKSISPDHHVLTSSPHSSSPSLTTSELSVSARDVYQNYPLPFEAFIFDTMATKQIVEDLSEIEDVNEEKIVSVLKERFLKDQIYTRVKHSLLIVVNPYKDSRETIQEISERYLAEYKNTDIKERLPVHIFQHVNQAYFHMRRTRIDQSILLSGLCGSGKSEMNQWILYHLITLSNPKKPTKLQQLIQMAYSALEAFGHAKTTVHDNASRFGKHLELQFNEKGRMVGAKIMDYMLEGSRITQANGDERNFHIFYYMLHGSTPEIKSLLHLDEVASYTYLFKTKEAARLAAALVEQDTEKYNELRTLLKSLGVHKGTFLQMMQILAAILHLGNLHFADDATNIQDSAIVKNMAELEIAAELLGVEPKALETCLTYQTKLIKRDLTTIFLNAEQAALQRDTLAETLYKLLFSWLIEMFNKKLNKAEFQNTIGIIDFPGAAPIGHRSFEQLLMLYANERLYHYMLHQIYERNSSVYSVLRVPAPTFPNTLIDDCVQLFDRPQTGLLTTPPPSLQQPSRFLEILKQNHRKNPCLSFKTGGQETLFSVQHFTGTVTYSPSEFLTRAHETLCTDFILLFGPQATEAPTNRLVTKLFSQKSVSSSQAETGSERAVAGPIDKILSTLASSKNWYVTCLRSNDLLLPHSCDPKKLAAQIKTLHLVPLVERSRLEYTIDIDLLEFCERYADLIHATAVDLAAEPKEKFLALQDVLDWDEKMMIQHEEKVFLTESAWALLENKLRATEKREQRRARCIAKGIPFVEDDEEEFGDPMYAQHSCRSMTEAGSIYSEDCYEACCEESFYSQSCDHSTTTVTATTVESIFDDDEDEEEAVKAQHNDYSEQQEKEPKKKRISPSRGFWVTLTWLTTWWIPSFMLSHGCGMRRSDIRMAWREKVTLCMVILLLCAAMVWFIAFFGQLVCPHQDLYTQSELQAKSGRDNAYIVIRGEVFDLTSFAPRHWASEVIPTSALFQYAGQDASDLFPVQVSALCDGIDGYVAKEVTMDTHINITDSNSIYHDFRYFRQDYRPDWYFEQMVYLRTNYRIGFMGYDPVDIKDQSTNPIQIGGIRTKRRWAILHDSVYDLTSYMMGGRVVRAPEGQTVSADIDMDFIDNSITELFRQLAGTDISAHFDALPLDKTVRERQLTCLRNLFLVGKVDSRNSLQCLFSEYILLLITGFLCSVILFKFLAALRLGSEQVIEEYDKFIICQVPCYTEGEESLRKTIDSLTVLRYDDKRKLLFLIADGMIVGSGNDRSTPRIVLDILGVDPNLDPEPMSFLSLGEGKKQHNMGKVYSGLYECSGHVVPFVVVVKVGTTEERQKPGNRGKRDSQMVLMRFLNKVHFDSLMTPLELEIHHQLKNVIGVNPSFYEFVLMVDADTEVLPYSLNRMVSCFVHDAKIVGLCGETMLSNEKDTWVTMIQVYEYYISHHLAKAFESLFGSVTCLPGCFCMYRIRSSIRNQPLLASHEIINDYAENQVDTLHKKNLLHLGEDRYLTTLILKHFPHFKTKFTPDAACMTNAPDQWPVLLSQRRRWINSTIHNLGELMFLPQLCGFCCFSMRFVVMLDLLSTLVMPAVVCYLGYLIYQLCTNTNQVPLMSIITLAGVYGLQAIIFIIRRKWEHVGWMIIYILAIPVFSFFIPLYSFWHFDDFSWGNTRIVVGEQGQKKAVGPDEGTFDPSVIPMKRWSEHEQEMTREEEEELASEETKTCSEVDGYRDGDTCSSDHDSYCEMPDDETIFQEIVRILGENDLMELSKKQVRDILSDIFQIDMNCKKEFINGCIDQLLK
ncbi:hypothetical protein G6F16_001778 [Rhizopus arrhizus]|uniref:chitin synthase n=1 Tax=Rhizopus oryzae TaxID=64495 RepID=A0A9P6XFC3_RHIOR|nr:hypothetical protein G6F21_006503 [Rhizopus arrhizus]KAG0802022.1 hypothetical protein G6F22_000671 [Rhizopus arrhizus]KAG0818644.1 hypothetical protein G6F20_001390 [Rhizopus arrhizus]KAG0841171.1 hypothetical protein G6F19_001685 [Rhizopus arrhizus]KAG0844333.1 hypothetical protein G6F18_001972 [Rhizopus arrhizus]